MDFNLFTDCYGFVSARLSSYFTLSEYDNRINVQVLNPLLIYANTDQLRLLLQKEELIAKLTMVNGNRAKAINKIQHISMNL